MRIYLSTQIQFRTILAFLFILFSANSLAQSDVLQSVSSFYNPCGAGELSIPVDFDGQVGTDYFVIIENIAGYGVLDPAESNKTFKFASGFSGICEESGAGEFRIRFESTTGDDIGVNKISFEISRISNINYSVTSYQGGFGTKQDYSSSNPFDFLDCTNEFEYFVIEADEQYLSESDLFVLDNLIVRKLAARVTPDPAVVCAGESLALNGNPIGGEGTLSHIWKDGITEISTSQTPTFSSTSSGVHNITYTFTDDDGCSATDGLTITVDPATVGGSISGGTSVCAGTNSTTLTLSGHTSNVLMWQSSTDNWTSSIDIANTTTTLTATNLTATTKYRAVVKSGTCAQANSADATITVDPATVGGSISGGTTVCTGTNSTTLTLSGHTGSVVMWQSSTNNWTSSTDISNTTTTLTATNLTATTKYRAVVKSGTCNQANSGEATITVDPATVGGSISGGTSVCAEINSTTLTLSGHTGNVLMWQSSTDNWTSSIDIANTTTTLTASNLTVTKRYRAVVKSGSCPEANSSDAIITVNPLPVVTAGVYGPLCKDEGLITVVGSPAGGTWSGTSVTNTSNGEATFNPELAGEFELTYSFIDGNGCGNDDNTFITVNDIPNIICVMDLSYSMNRDFEDNPTSNPNQKKLPMAKAALEGFVDLVNTHLGDGFCPNIGLARFPDSPQNGCDANSVKILQVLDESLFEELTDDPNIPVSAGDPDDPAIIKNLVADGNSTPLLQGITAAIDMFGPSDQLKMIVLLSDGRHNCPTGTITAADTDPILEAMGTDIKLYSIGFGLNTSISENLFNTLSTHHYSIDNLTDKNGNLDPGSSYIPGSTTEWHAKTALAATYGSILQEGLPGIGHIFDPLDIINKGSRKQIIVPVNEFDRKVVLYLSWVTPQVNLLPVKVIAPNGREIPLNQAGIKVSNRSSHTIISVSDEILRMNGMTGDWVFEIDGSDISSSAEHYQYTVFNASRKVSLKTWTDKDQYYTGEEMKIYLELLVDNRPLTPLDEISVYASRPGIGLGSWLASKKLNSEQVLQMKRSQYEEFLKYEMERPGIESMLSAKKPKSEAALKKLFEGNSDPIQLRAQILRKEFKMDYPNRILLNDIVFNDNGKEGDEKPGDGIYTAVYDQLRTEGGYQFYISVTEKSKNTTIKRESQLQKYVNVRIKPQRFVKDIVRLDNVLKERVFYNIIFKLQDKYGNIPSPDALGELKLSLSEGALEGPIQFNLDGTYSQKISLPENSKLKQVKMSMSIYDQTGEQRLASRLPGWISIITGFIIIMLTINRRKRSS